MKTSKAYLCLLVAFIMCMLLIEPINASEAPSIISPVNGATLSGSTETFTWTASGTTVSAWWLWAGPCNNATLGGCGDDYYNSGQIGSGTLTISGLPTDGSTVYIRLWYNSAGWKSVLFQYTAANDGGGGTSTETFSWTAPTLNEDGSELTDLSGYKLYYGTEPGKYTKCIDVGLVSNYQINDLITDRNYYFSLTAYDTSGNESSFSDELSIEVKKSDTTPPVISVLYISNITDNSAKINWLTDEASDSQVEYGTTPSYGHVTTLDKSLETIHSQTLSLLPSTRYYYRIYSRDAFGNLGVSASRSFMNK